MKIFVYLLVFITFVNSLTFLQLTDIHFDSQYLEDSQANCLFGSTGLKCCRETSIGIKPYRNASKWGDYNCDSSLLFIEESLKWISENIETPDFIIWNGDSVDHHDFTQSLNKNLNEINITTSLLYKYF